MNIKDYKIINDFSIVDSKTFILFPLINSINVYENSSENISYQWQTLSGIEDFSYETQLDSNLVFSSIISLDDNSLIVAGWQKQTANNYDLIIKKINSLTGNTISEKVIDTSDFTNIDIETDLI